MDVSYVILSQIFVLVNVQYAQNHNFRVIFFLFIPRVRGKMTKTELLRAEICRGTSLPPDHAHFNIFAYK